MANHLAGLQNLSVSFRDGYDVVQSSGQKVEFGETRRITLARPNQLRVEEIASDGRLDLALFDGKNITVFDGDSNVYASTPQPGTVDDALVFFVRDLRMRMPLARLLSSRLPSEWPKRVTTVDYVESLRHRRREDAPYRRPHRRSGLPVLDHRRPTAPATARRVDVCERTRSTAVLGKLLGLEHKPATGEVDIRIHAAGGRKTDRLRSPGLDIRRRPATTPTSKEIKP